MSISIQNEIDGVSGRALFDDAVRFWEPWRIPYNAILFGIVIESTGLLALLKWPTVPLLVILAAIANLLYCSAYPLDLLMQWSGVSDGWKRWGRHAVFVSGTLFAAAIAVMIASSLR